MLPFASAAEQPVKADPLTVNEKPLAAWGMGWSGKTSAINFLGWLPLYDLVVLEVHLGSPADIAGIQTSDEILNIAGRPVREIPVRELVDITAYAERKEVSVDLHNRVTNENRTVLLKPKPKHTWQLDHGKTAKWHLWGIFIHSAEPKEIKFGRGDAQQRSITITLAGKKIGLIQRRDGTVELFEGKLPPEPSSKKGKKAPEIIHGRVLPRGSTLVLKPDGTYEVNAAAPSSSPADAKEPASKP